MYPVFEDEQITCKVKEDYNLQKLGIGAYKLSVVDDDKLKHLKSTHHQILTNSASYMVLHNVVEGAGLSAVLILTRPIVLARDQTLFRIVYPRPFRFEVPVTVERGEEEAMVQDEDVVLEKVEAKVEAVATPNISALKNLFKASPVEVAPVVTKRVETEVDHRVAELQSENISSSADFLMAKFSEPPKPSTSKPSSIFDRYV